MTQMVAVPKKFTDDVKVLVRYIDDWNLQVADGDVKRAHDDVKFMLKESTWDLKPPEPKSELETPAGKINVKLEKLTSKQALEIDELKEQLKDRNERLHKIKLNLICIGGPLNDNKDGFNAEQKKVCFRILDLSEIEIQKE